MSQTRQKWYKEIVASQLPKLPENPTGSQLQDHKAIKSLRLIARGSFPTGQKLITTYFFPLDPTKAPKFRQGTGGQNVLMETFTSSQIARAKKNPTKNGPEVLRSSNMNFEVAYQPQRSCVCQHYRRKKDDFPENCRLGTKRYKVKKQETPNVFPVINLVDDIIEDASDETPTGSKVKGSSKIGDKK